MSLLQDKLLKIKDQIQVIKNLEKDVGNNLAGITNTAIKDLIPTARLLTDYNELVVNFYSIAIDPERRYKFSRCNLGICHFICQGYAESKEEKSDSELLRTAKSLKYAQVNRTTKLDFTDITPNGEYVLDVYLQYLVSYNAEKPFNETSSTLHLLQVALKENFCKHPKIKALLEEYQMLDILRVDTIQTISEILSISGQEIASIKIPDYLNSKKQLQIILEINDEEDDIYAEYPVDDDDALPLHLSNMELSADIHLNLLATGSAKIHGDYTDYTKFIKELFYNHFLNAELNTTFSLKDI